MVSNPSDKENGVEAGSAKLPPGKYRIVGFDLDLTGRRIVDEICQIAAFTPNSQFAQYVMPFRDLNGWSMNRYLLKIATAGRYRMLKCIKTGEVLKTKSEISAMTDFLQWLEGLKEEGVILLTHDDSMDIPCYLLDALNKYKLMDRFSAVVKGFANSVTFSEERKPNLATHSLSYLGKLLLGTDEGEHSAAGRAKLSYQIVQRLCTGEDDKGSGDATSTPETDSPAMSEALRQIATTLEDTEKRLEYLKGNSVRQNGLRRVFGVKLTAPYWLERTRALQLWKLLTETDLSYESLSGAWESGKKDSLMELVKERIGKSGKQEKLDDVMDVLLDHFDPDYVSKHWERRTRRTDKTQSGDGGRKTGREESKGEKSGESTGGEKSDGKQSPGKSPVKEESSTSSPVQSTDDKETQENAKWKVAFLNGDGGANEEFGS